ncbi:MAG: phosphodiester glycosidase family protein [Paracoccaceae bacterium]
MRVKSLILHIFLFAALFYASTPAAHAACRDITFEARPYTVCQATSADDLRLFHTAPDGQPYTAFQPIIDDLAGQGATLGFAMNAGMFHRDYAPVGLYIDPSKRTDIITSDGPGNFGLLPNGVFCIADTFAVIESRNYQANPPTCTYATQSGPMLVINGALHPKFLPNSDSVNIRNGVGVSADGTTAIFAISNTPVNFHQFARLFRDVLKTPNALYLDGSISRLYAPDLKRHDGGFPLGPIIGTVIPKP